MNFKEALKKISELNIAEGTVLKDGGQPVWKIIPAPTDETKIKEYLTHIIKGKTPDVAATLTASTDFDLLVVFKNGFEQGLTPVLSETWLSRYVSFEEN